MGFCSWDPLLSIDTAIDTAIGPGTLEARACCVQCRSGRQPAVPL